MVPQPSAVTSPTTHDLVSTYDLLKPAKANEMFRRYGDQHQGFFQVLNTLGYRKKETRVDQIEFDHYEEDWIWENMIVLANVASPGAGAPISFTLDPNSLDASNRFFVQEGDDVMFSNYVTGHVTDVDVSTPTAPIVTVEPQEATDTIPAVTAGEEILIHSNGFPEGTDQPDGRVSEPSQWKFYAKIIKERVSTTGTSAAEGMWVDMLSDGQPIPVYYMKAQIDMDWRMGNRIDGAMLFDKPTTNTTLTATGERSMWGLDPWIRAGGNIGSYTAGSFSVADFDNFDNILDRQKAPDEMLGAMGIDIFKEIENTLMNFYDDGAIVYASYQQGISPMKLNIGFKSYTKSGRTYHFHKIGIFNHPKSLGTAGYTIKKNSYFCPIDKRKDARGNWMPSIGCRYLEKNGYSRMMETWTHGAAGKVPIKTTGLDKQFFDQRCEIGSEFLANNRFLLAQPA